MLEYERFFENTFNPVILDIGTNDGLDAVNFSKKFPNATIHCFEPDPRAINRFMELSAMYANLTLHQIAIGSVNGTVPFYQSDGFPPDKASRDLRPQGWDLSGSIRKPTGHIDANPWCTFEKTIDVRSMTLDSWLLEHPSIKTIEFMRLDTQGAEGDIFKNCPLALSRTNYIFTEFSNDEWFDGQVSLAELDRILENFEIMQVFDNDVLFKSKTLNSTGNQITYLG